MTPSQYLAAAGLSLRPLAEALADPRGRIGAHLRRPDSGDLACVAGLGEEIALYETPRGEPPLFVSYYTTDTPYEALAADLRGAVAPDADTHAVRLRQRRGKRRKLLVRGGLVASVAYRAGLVAHHAFSHGNGPIGIGSPPPSTGTG